MEQDSISLTIEAESKKASASIEALVKNLKSLQTALSQTMNSLNNVSNSLRNMGNAFDGSKTKRDIDDIKDSVNRLNESTKNVKSPFGKFGTLESQLKTLGLPDLNSNFYTLKNRIKDATSETTTYTTKTGQLVTVTKQTKDGLEGVRVKLKEVNDEAKKGESLWSRLTKGLTGSAAKMIAAWYGVTRTARKIKDITDSATEYEEALNLFTVTMGTNAEKAMQWVTKFSRALYIDDAGLMQYMGSLNSLISGLGVGAENSYLMSKNLTQLVYDLSSFKNLDIETSFRKIQSAMSGEIEPLRNVGVALSQNTLQELANELGIKQRVATMSEAEKAQLRYIQIIKSTTEWQGDMARTLISPANALRVLKQQFTLLGRAIGRVFIPFVMKAIPYIMALTQILTDFANKLAAMFGYEITDIDYSSLTGIKDNIIDIGDEAEDTTKKLNTMLAPFDELNVVQKKNEGTSGLASLGGDLGLPLPEYDALAGLTAQMAENVDKAKKRLKDMIPIVKTIAGLLIGFKVVKTLGNVAQWLSGTGSAIKNLSSLFGFKGKKGGTTSLNTTLKETSKTANIARSTESAFRLPKWSTIIKGLGQLGLVVTAVIAYIGVVGLFMKIPGVEETVQDGTRLLVDTFSGLLKIVIPLAAFSAGVVALGMVSIAQVSKGLANMGIVILGTETVILAVGAINSIAGSFISSGIDTMKKVLNGISDVALQLGVLSAALFGVGFIMTASGGTGYLAILAGLGAFAEVIVGLGVVLAALGGLQQIPGFNWIIGEGGKLLMTIGDTLGGFVGSIVAGFVGKATSSLPKIGTHLSEFMENATPFFEKSSMIDKDTMKGIEYLTGALLKLTGQNILESLTSWFTGGSSLTKFGKDLADFAPYFTEYADEIKGVDSEVVLATSNAVESIMKFARKVPNEGGMISWFAGDNKLGTFATYLPSFGQNLKKYYGYIKDVDSSIIEGSSNAAESIMKFARKVPNEGGMISWFVGENKLDKFSEALPMFGYYLSQYYKYVKNIDSNVVDKTAEAADSIMTFARRVPNEGGLKAWFSGDNNIADFGEKLADFGESFSDYYDSIKWIDTDHLVDSVNGVLKLVDALILIKNNNLAKVLSDFSNGLKKATPNFSGFFNNTFGGDKSYSLGYNFGTEFGKGLKEGIKSTLKLTLSLTNNLGNIISSFSIKPYAEGGFPNVGELFLARENGAEMVGRIGNQTAVANNDQITTAFKNAVIEAFNSVNFGNRPSTTIVNVAGRKVYEGIGEYVNSENDRYGTNYVNV